MALMWKDKWKSIQSKFDTCTKECLIAYRSDEKCKDSIEAVISDIWNLRDWLKEDPSVRIPDQDILKFIDTPEAYNIRACGDVEMVTKHFIAKNPKYQNAELVWEGNHNHPSGYPIVFKVIIREKEIPENATIYEDAWELGRRAIEEWRVFLTKHRLI